MFCFKQFYVHVLCLLFSETHDGCNNRLTCKGYERDLILVFKAKTYYLFELEPLKRDIRFKSHVLHVTTVNS
jgi:hypothetical protein